MGIILLKSYWFITDKFYQDGYIERGASPQIPAAHSKTRCAAVFLPWHDALNHHCTGLKRSDEIVAKYI